MDFSDSLAALNIQLGDTGDITFTSDEKERALTKAWNDAYVTITVWDSSLTFATGTYQYALPDTLTTVKDIYISVSNSTTDAPEPISSDLWEVVEGNIQFSPKASFISTGYVLYLKGNYKLDPEVDTLDSVNLQEYVLANAGYQTLLLLSYKKVNLFLKNDTTVSELIALKREFQRDMKEYRTLLAKEYESS